VYVPLAVPIKATPAADPIASMLPPVPAVSVTRSHCPRDITGSMDKTANITGILSTIAEKIPTSEFAMVGPRSVYIIFGINPR